jgi:hypothetical protein
MIHRRESPERLSALTQGVNFFGHAAVATWSAPASGATPGVVLGAMLPDFATMCGGRIAAADEADVADGIALHHTTDSVFHQLPVVTGLMHELDEHLARGGCARGPRRAVAHIGMELLLDGALLDEPAYRAAYLRGLSHDPGPALHWRDPDAAPRFTMLLTRLRARGVPEDLRSPDAITTRLQHILAHRPLLAPSLDDLRAIRSALIAFKPRLEIAADAVVRGVRAALG